MQALQQIFGSFKTAPRTLKLVFTTSPGLLVGLCIVTLLSALLAPAIAWAGKRIMDAAVAQDGEAALLGVALEAGLVVGSAIAIRGSGLIKNLLGGMLSVGVNLLILQKAQGFGLKEFEDPAFYDELTRARREASLRPISMMSGIFEIIQNSLTLLGYIALLVRWSPLLVGVLLISVLPATLAELKFSEEGFKLWSWRAPDSRKLGYLEYILANEGFAKELRMMGLQKLLLSRFSELAQRLRLQDKTLAMQRTFWAGGLSLLGTFAFYGCYAGLAWDAATRRITLGDLTLYVVAFRQGQQAFQSVLGALGGMYENNLYMSNLFAFLDRPAPEPKLQLQTPLKAMDGIRFVDVSFQYPGQSKKALDTINLHIPSGQSLALVGHNGSGKTTFIKLLTGLYTPTEGQILLDGRALAAWDPGQLRQRMAVIFQDFNRYQAPLFENVGFGNPARLEERALQEQALKKSGGEKFLIEHGLEKQLGRWFDKQGMELSGGQWQMVALARALVREEADVLILDEPTAALDAMAEAEVFTQVQGMAQGKTSILISHRFPTVRGADQIVVLEGGKIVEQGRHTELLEQGGRYAQLFTLQAQGYQ